MKQESNKRLYFTNDFSPENVAELQAQGYALRKASAYHEADTLEACAEVAGDVPQAYLDLIKRNKANIVTANVQVSITPELQKVIDDAKAECEKVVAESNELKERLNKEREAMKKLTAEKDALLTQVKDLETKLKKQSDTEAKAAKAAATKAEQQKE